MFYDILPLPTVPDQLLGPYGLVVGCLVLIWFGSRMLWWFIKDLQSQRDIALNGWREQTEATKEVATAVEERNRTEAERLRISQAREDGAANAGRPTPRRRRRAKVAP